MNQRESMIEEAKQVLATLRATEEEMKYEEHMTNIVINKGRIVEVEVTKEVVQEVVIDNTDYNAVEELKGQIALLEKQLEEAQAKIAELETTEDEIAVEETKEEEQHEEQEINKGGDAMSSLINVPDKYLAYPIIVETLNYWVAEIENAKEKKLGSRVVLSKEKAKEMAIRKANEELAKHMSDIDKMLAYNVTHDETYSASGSITSTYGKITLGGKEYAFKYDATFELPCVFGCMNMDLIREAKAVLDAIVVIDRDETQLGQKHIHETIYDFDNNIVVWISDDGCFKGYTDKYAFVWDPAQAQPCGITVINALSNFRKYRKMNKSWGNGFVARAEFIMNYCRQIANKVTNEEEIEDTNEVVVNFTKEETAPEVTEEIVTECDDLDI